MSQRKIRHGEVVSDKMDKTRVVVISRLVQHQLYKKRIWRKKRVYAHDEENKSHIGDFVKICETRPVSKNKRWKILEITKKGL